MTEQAWDRAAGVFIDGIWRHGRSVVTVENPATEQAFASVHGGTAEDVDAAVAAARRALPDWSASLPETRAAFLDAIADRARAAARRVRTGQVDINGGRFNPLAPFGGIKESGHGRELGEFGLAEFLSCKSMQF